MDLIIKHDRIVPNKEYEILKDAYEKMQKVDEIENICEKYKLAKSIDSLRNEMLNAEMSLELRKEMLDDLKNNELFNKLDEFELLKGGYNVLCLDDSNLSFYKFDKILQFSKVYKTENYSRFVEFIQRHHGFYTATNEDERFLVDIFLKIKLLGFIFENGNLHSNGVISLKGDVDSELGYLRNRNYELEKELKEHKESHKTSIVIKENIIKDSVKSNQRKRGIIFLMGVVITVLTGFLIFG
ncbi:hypothetical protein BPT24_080 [Tenacibaculum phage pT24]|uniref:Uncharacterized protein n=1 Tax=Tenacibaculum phage pT24 TaxID=1880590 RepID=A0A1B4XWP1_9CAUD|nr:hypothetical protein HYP10_gp080 [Tenacibaculum phage pT24]BAV39205.1 hypothetical protein BPT24_080 [Tenacibaculum phage pT24]